MKSPSSSTHVRNSEFILMRFEKWFLPRVAGRLPGWVTPDKLTILALLAATGVGLCFILSNRDPLWLWGVVGGLVLHWFGDSLDGTLARVRQIQRPRYGYYLDHLCDAYSTFAIGLGLGLSPYMLLGTGLAIVTTYLVMSINVYLETNVFGEFRFGYGLLGPTEARIALMLLAGVAYFAQGWPFNLFGIGMTVFDIVGILGAVAMSGLVLSRIIRNLRQLATWEPPGVVKR